MRLHASCVQWQGIGVLLRGPSGAGKSDLALRLIDQGAILVADDQVLLNRANNQLLARPPDMLAGLLEVRGLGILGFDYQAPIPVGLVIDLVPEERLERMPDPSTIALLDIPLPFCALAPYHASTPLKVHLAVRQANGSIMTVR